MLARAPGLRWCPDSRGHDAAHGGAPAQAPTLLSVHESLAASSPRRFGAPDAPRTLTSVPVFRLQNSSSPVHQVAAELAREYIGPIFTPRSINQSAVRFYPTTYSESLPTSWTTMRFPFFISFHIFRLATLIFLFFVFRLSYVLEIVVIVA